MTFWSTGAGGMSIGREPEARITLSASMTSVVPSALVTSTFLPASSLPWPWGRSNAVGLEQSGNATGQVLDDASLAANHRWRRPSSLSASGDTVDVEALFGFLVLPGAVQQRLGRNATHVQAGAAQGQLALGVSVYFRYRQSLQTKLGSLDGSHDSRQGPALQSPLRRISGS